jgi:hypothetical protein
MAEEVLMKKFAVRVCTGEQHFAYTELARCSSDAAASAAERFGLCGVTVIALRERGDPRP